jgi:hypothetical protein
MTTGARRPLVRYLKCLLLLGENMRSHWTTAALLGSLLAAGSLAGCNQNPPNAEENHPVTAAPNEAAEPDATPPPVSSNSDSARPAAQPPRSSAPGRTAPAPKPVSSGSSVKESPIADEQPAPVAPRVEYRDLKLPVGTALPLELATALSSETSQVETPVRARLKQTIAVEGFPVLPAGTEFSGFVTEVGQAGRVKGRARLVLAFTEATVDGAKEKLRTNPITFEAEASKGEDATKIGAGAGIGAVIGGILGGGSGAAKGAAIGGAAGTGAVLATKGKDVTVAAGADIAATLAEPSSIRVRVP